MNSLHKHIILIGFKHVGKSVIGKELAAKLQHRFIDLDKETENLYAAQFRQELSCRQIMQNHGQEMFKQLENKALVKVLAMKPAIISLGGGTPLNAENQQLILPHTLVHIKAPAGIVFERIMLNGKPAFFSEEENPFTAFKKLWDEREKIYQQLTDFIVDNADSVASAVDKIIQLLPSKYR